MSKNKGLTALNKWDFQKKEKKKLYSFNLIYQLLLCSSVKMTIGISKEILATQHVLGQIVVIVKQ